MFFFACKCSLFSTCRPFCQTLGLVLRLRVDFVLPLSQQQQEEEEEEEQPLTKNLSVGSILEG